MSNEVENTKVKLKHILIDRLEDQTREIHDLKKKVDAQEKEKNRYYDWWQDEMNAKEKLKEKVVELEKSFNELEGSLNLNGCKGDA